MCIYSVIFVEISIIPTIILSRARYIIDRIISVHILDYTYNVNLTEVINAFSRMDDYNNILFLIKNLSNNTDYQQ